MANVQSKAKTVMVYSDPTKGKGVIRRPVSAISWCSDGGSKIAIGYCSPEFLGTLDPTPTQGENRKIIYFQVSFNRCSQGTLSTLRTPPNIVTP